MGGFFFSIPDVKRDYAEIRLPMSPDIYEFDKTAAFRSLPASQVGCVRDLVLWVIEPFHPLVQCIPITIGNQADGQTSTAEQGQHQVILLKQQCTL